MHCILSLHVNISVFPPLGFGLETPPPPHLVLKVFLSPSRKQVGEGIQLFLSFTQGPAINVLERLMALTGISHLVVVVGGGGEH